MEDATVKSLFALLLLGATLALGACNSTTSSPSPTTNTLPSAPVSTLPPASPEASPSAS